MSFPSTPNRLEAVFVQRNTGNTRYDQINISGSDLIVYLDAEGKINADKISTWAATYGIGGGGTSASSSWASQSRFSSTASFATLSLTSYSSSWASHSFTSTSASYSLSASYALSASKAESASYALSSSNAISASYAISSSNTVTASYAISASQSQTSSYSLVSGLAYTASYITASAIDGTVRSAASSSFASSSLSASYVSSSNIVGPVISASYALTASFALNGGGGGGSSSIAYSASTDMLSLDGTMWGFVPFFNSTGQMTPSTIGVNDGKTVRVYASSSTTFPMDRVFYIGRDGNVNTWAAMGFYNDAGGVNAKYWLNYADQANNLEWSAVSDDFSIVTPWLTVTRSGSAITQILFQRAITVGGNVLPVSSLTHSLGTASLQWKNAWIQNVFGTSSWANTSSFALFANNVISSSFATTSSYAFVAQSVLGSIENATYALSASWASSSLSASVARTSSLTLGTASYAISASRASSSINTLSSSVSLTASFVLGTIESASFAQTASYLLGFVTSASNALTASYSLLSALSTTSSYSVSSSAAATASYLLGFVESASFATTASFAVSSSRSVTSSFAVSSSRSVTASYVLGNTDSASYAFTASFLLGSIESASYALTASNARTASNALSSAYPWNVNAASHPFHSARTVLVGTSTYTPASQLVVHEPVTNSISQSVAVIQGHRTDTTAMALEVRNLSISSNANSRAGLLLGLGPPSTLEGGIVFVTRTSTPAQGLVNGLNISPLADSADIGFRTGQALSGSVAGPQLQLKSSGLIGIGVATPVNARLHIGGTEVAYYNATIRLTNGAAGGGDFYFAATDNNWGFPAANKLLIGTGDPSSIIAQMQIDGATGFFGMGLSASITPSARLHVDGNITASQITASRFVGTASWAFNVVSSSFASTASYLLGSVNNAVYAISASWASSSISSSYSITSSYSDTSGTASLLLGSVESASYAGTASVLLGTITSASYALTASHALNGGGGGAGSKVIVLCSAFTPWFTGADAAEIPIPYDSNGTTPVSWSVSRLNLRVQLSGSTTSSVSIERSAASGLFTTIQTLGTLNLNSQSYQTFTGSLGNLVSGDKIRFNVNTIGTSQYWTITAEIASL